MRARTTHTPVQERVTKIVNNLNIQLIMRVNADRFSNPIYHKINRAKMRKNCSPSLH